MSTQKFSKQNLPLGDWHEFRRKVWVTARRMSGPFEVEARIGLLRCPDGYLVIGADGWPYPMAKEEFEKLYEMVGQVDGCVLSAQGEGG